MSKDEQYIISLIREGKANREIAAEMHISEEAVKNRIHRLLKKYKCRNRVQLAMMEVPHGTIER